MLGLSFTFWLILGNDFLLNLEFELDCTENDFFSITNEKLLVVFEFTGNVFEHSLNEKLGWFLFVGVVLIEEFDADRGTVPINVSGF